jgi:ABC-type branched-subunit amino acid transport system ATPase component/sugar phosphate permease
MDDAAVLARRFLEEEQERRGRAQPDDDVVLPDELLPGFGGEELGLGETLRQGGRFLFLILVLLAVVEELDRAAVTVLAPDIQSSLGVSDTVLAALVGASGVLFVLGAVPMGVLADRTNRIRIIGVTTLVWGVLVALTAAVRTTFQFGVTRLGTGLGQSNALPVQGSVLADAYPIAGRGRVYALVGAGRPLGQLVGPLLAGAVAAIAGGATGWRWSFVAAAIPALVLGALVLTRKDPVRGQNEQRSVLGDTLTNTETVPISTRVAFARLRKVRTFYALLLGAGAIGFALFSVPLLVSLHLEDAFGYDAFDRGIVLAVVQLGSLVAAPFMGRQVDRLARRSPVRVLHLGAALLAIYGITIAIAVFLPGIVAFSIVLTIATAAAFCGFLVLSPIVAAVVPYRLRAQGFAMMGVYIFLLGAFGGLVVGGALSDEFGEQVAIAAIAPAASLVGAILIARGGRDVRLDISNVVEEIREEQAERERLRADPDDIPVLQVRHVDAGYGPVQVLFGIDLDVRRHEVLALLGTNGAGKSTLLKTISGVLVPDRGAIRFNGRTLTYTDAEHRFKEGIVLVRGGGGIFPSLTVRENLSAFLLTTRDKHAVDEGIARFLDVFPSFHSRLGTRAADLSGGQQQMLALGLAVVQEPELLLIDELSLGLAPIVIEELVEVVASLRARGVTMVIVDQSLDVASMLAERAVFLERGRVRFDGRPSELLERDDLARAVFLGHDTNGASPPRRETP